MRRREICAAGKIFAGAHGLSVTPERVSMVCLGSAPSPGPMPPVVAVRTEAGRGGATCWMQMERNTGCAS